MSRVLRMHAELLLAVVIGFNVWQAVIADDTFMRAITIVVVVGLVALVGYRYGHHRATLLFLASLAWLPKDVVWHVDDEGHRHLLVTSNDNTVHTIELPDEIDSGEEAFQYLLDELQPKQ